MPESQEHIKIKNLLSDKLKEWFGLAITEFSSSGHELDVYTVTYQGISIYIEVIWSSSWTHFLYDINEIKDADEDVKLVIASPEILRKEKFVNYFNKTVSSQRKLGYIVHGDLLDGKAIIDDPGSLDKEIKETIFSLVDQAKQIDKATRASIRKQSKKDISLDPRIVNVSLREYVAQIIENYNNFSDFERRGVKPVIQQFSVFDLKKYYINVYVQDLNNRRIEDAVNLVERWLNQEELNGLFIIGDFGTGKTTLCAQMAYVLARAFSANSRIPLYIPLRYIDRISKETILAEIRKAIRIDWKNLLRLSDSGKVVFILDGFDEMITRTDWKKTSSEFQNIVKLFCKKDSKVIVTCRTHFFKKDSEIWGEDTKLMKSLRATENFRIVSMVPFSKKQIFDFIRRRTKDPEKIWSQIRKTYNLEDLCKRPLLIDMIISTLPKLVSLGSPINAAMLYEKYTEDWIKRDKWRAQLDPDQKAVLMEKIAFQLFCQAKSVISLDNIEEIIEKEFGIKPETDVAKYFDYDIRTCSFFHRDSMGNYGFMHKSFLEFFVAKKIARGLNFGNFADLNCKSLTWETIFFTSFLLDPSVNAVLLNAVYTTKGKTTAEFGLLGGNAFKLLVEMCERKFEGKDFSFCAITDVNFSKCSFTNCRFDKSKMQQVKFNSTTIKGCSFEQSYLESCEVDRTKIINSNFRKCEFSNTLFTLSEILDDCQMSFATFRECNFEGVILNRMDLTEVSFRNSKAGFDHRGGVSFVEANLKSARFDNSSFLLSLFYKSDVQEAIFKNCDFGGSCFYNCDFSSANFEGCSIPFASLLKVDFSSSRFIKTRFYTSFFSQNIMKDVVFEQTSIKNSEKPHHKVSDLDYSKTSFGQNLFAFSRLDHAVGHYSLSDELEEKAVELFLKSRKNIKGSRKVEAMGACFYALIKESVRPRSLKEIANLFNIPKISLSRLYRKLLNSGQVKHVGIDAKRWVEIFSEELKITKKSTDLAKKILDIGTKELAMKRTPTTNAASALYLACQKNSEKITQKSIASVAGVTTVTISSANKAISELLKSKGYEF